MAVELSVAGPVYASQVLVLEPLVVNTGSEPLTGVQVKGLSGAFSARCESSAVDEVMDPGDAWPYRCVTWGDEGWARIDASATTLTGDPVAARGEASFGVLEPAAIQIDGPSEATFGSNVTWSIYVTNVADFALLEAVLWCQLAPDGNYDTIEPISRGLDDDREIDPGERWVWEYGTSVHTDQSYLEVWLNWLGPPLPPPAPASTVYGWQTHATSRPIDVAPPIFAAIELEAHVVEPVVRTGPLALHVQVSNTGTQPLLPPEVDEGDAGGVSIWCDAGRDDPSFEPGAVWNYDCLSVAGGSGGQWVAVTSSAADGTPASATAWVPFTEQSPVALTLSGPSEAGPSRFSWTVTVTNVAEFSLSDPTLGVRLMYIEDRASPTPYNSIWPESRGTDSNDTLDPGEAWRWVLTYVVDHDPSWLEVWFHWWGPVVTRPGRGDELRTFGGIDVTSDPVSPRAPGSSTTVESNAPTQTIPATGSATATERWIACFLAVAGCALLGLARRSTWMRGDRCQSTSSRGATGPTAPIASK